MVPKNLCSVLALCLIGEALAWDAAFETWHQTCGALKHVSVGHAGVWGVNSADVIWYQSDTYGEEEIAFCAWQRVPGALKQLDVGRDVVWGVNAHDAIYYRAGISVCKPKGWDWVHVSGALKHVSVSQNGHVWGVNRHDRIYHRIGASWSNPGGDSWRQISGALKQISVGRSGVWGVNSGDNIYYRLGTYGDLRSDPDGSGWKQVSGSLKYVSSADMVYGVNRHDVIYSRQGVTCKQPWGTRWQQIDGRAKQIESLSNFVWAVNSDDNIYRKLTDE